MEPSREIATGKGPGSFRTTCWTDVLRAGGKSLGAQESFSRLYQDYWPPLFSYLRRRGLTEDQAEEAIQGFFVAIFEKQGLAGIEREGGHFRSFLLKALQNFLARNWAREQALKRGGGATVLSLQQTGVDGQVGAAEDTAAELEFDREWATHVLKRARMAIEQEFQEGNRGSLYKAIHPFLQGDREGKSYSEAAAETGLSEATLRVTIHRMRHRFGEILRSEILRTVQSPAEVQDEVRHLLRVLAADPHS